MKPCWWTWVAAVIWLTVFLVVSGADAGDDDDNDDRSGGSRGRSSAEANMPSGRPGWSSSASDHTLWSDIMVANERGRSIDRRT